MRIEDDVKLDFCDVLIRPKRSTLGSRKDVTLFRDYQFKHSRQSYRGLPIMAANMDGVGTFAMAAELSKHGLFTCLTKHYSSQEYLENLNLGQVSCDHVSLSTGITDTDFVRTQEVMKVFPQLKYICIDVANGYSEPFLDAVSRYRDLFPDVTIIAGNVVTSDITEELVLRGADIVKVGLGPGAMCLTRRQTGVGYPQLSAIIECADAAHGLGAHIIADGGCTCPGDVAKAFGAGADFVMLGSMFAGLDEGGGKVFERVETVNGVVQTKKFVKFYGMSSTAAMEKHNGKVEEYRSSEGRVAYVPYRGNASSVVRDLLGGLRSACTYVGASKLKELPKRTTFVRVNGGRQLTTAYESFTVGS